MLARDYNTFTCLDTETLLSLSQHELHESRRRLRREVRGRSSLEVGKHLLLKQLERPCRTLGWGEFSGKGVKVVLYM